MEERIPMPLFLFKTKFMNTHTRATRLHVTLKYAKKEALECVAEFGSIAANIIIMNSFRQTHKNTDEYKFAENKLSSVPRQERHYNVVYSCVYCLVI